MNLTDFLTLAGVPADLHAEALASASLARKNNAGLTLAKWKVRLFRTGRIADLLDWSDERLCTKYPDLADWDIAPMVNITAHGDNGPWTPDGSRPLPKYWLNPDPASDEYKAAVACNYWLPGTHPRSKASVQAWYKRNAGEYRAWRMGAIVDPAQGIEIWRGSDGKTDVIVWRCGGVWLINASRKLVGSLHLHTRVGFELDNVFAGDYTPQMWWPIDGYQLRATVSYSTLPALGGIDLAPKRWEVTAPLAIGGTYTHWKPNA